MTYHSAISCDLSLLVQSFSSSARCAEIKLATDEKKCSGKTGYVTPQRRSFYVWIWLHLCSHRAFSHHLITGADADAGETPADRAIQDKTRADDKLFPLLTKSISSPTSCRFCDSEVDMMGGLAMEKCGGGPGGIPGGGGPWFGGPPCCWCGGGGGGGPGGPPGWPPAGPLGGPPGGPRRGWGGPPGGGKAPAGIGIGIGMGP